MALAGSNVDLLTPWGLRHMGPDDPAEVQSDNPFLPPLRQKYRFIGQLFRSDFQMPLCWLLGVRGMLSLKLRQETAQSSIPCPEIDMEYCL